MADERKEKLLLRDSLSAEERDLLSLQICRRVAASREFRSASKILIYKGVKSEVRLELLETLGNAYGKVFLYPRCLPEHRMEALLPSGPEAWREGAFHIPEPVPERSLVIPPEEIDLILCPCTVFDTHCSRTGMGGGFYDRYLPLCVKAVVAAVAYECQKSVKIERNPWDVPMDLVFTEQKTYFR